MGRTVKDRNHPAPKPVQKIELSENNIKRRFIAAIAFLVIGVTALVIWFMSFLSSGAGWAAITAYSSENGDCGADFSFQYELGRNGVSASTEEKAVKAAYTGAVQKAYRLFHENELFGGTVNVCYINRHPNEEITVDEALYNAFSTLKEYGSRHIYLAPVYVRYDDIFYCADDSGLIDFDPRLSGDVREEYAAIAAFANDPESVEVQLLGENKIKLFVSEKYLEYAKREGVSDFIGFFWLKNAFIADYIADAMTESGYTAGVISSFDGFTRNLDTSDTDYSLNIFNKNGGMYQAAVMHYKGAMSIVSYRSYPINSRDMRRFYTLQNGEIRTAYLDTADGLCKSSISELTACSREKTCAQTALETAGIYISDTLDEEALRALAEKRIYSIYCKDRAIVCSRPDIELSDIYSDENVKYTKIPS